mgnify:CR=1 FL=1
MKRVSFVLGTLAAGALASGCIGPTRSPNPLGHASPNKDLATQEQYPLKSSAVKQEVDRQLEERYPGTINWLFVWGKDRWVDLLDVAPAQRRPAAVAGRAHAGGGSGPAARGRRV